MSPRPQKASDEEVFAAAQRAMERLGPSELTLADIAEEAGVTAGALVHRFGSKRDLLLSLANRFGGSAKEMMDGLRAQHDSPLAVIRAYAECMALLAKSPDALARNLAYLQIDLIDPDFRKPLQTNARATRKELESLVREAVDARELHKGTDARSLALSIETVVSGALLTWAVHREGPPAAWMRARVDAILAPYLAPAARRSAGPSR
jgi:AcrR family transcriptional regulator